MTYDPIHHPEQREVCRTAAFQTLPALRHGDRVRVTNDGKTHDMTVSRGAHRCDGAYGSWESTRVTVTFGPGRYAFDVTAERIAAGQQSIERRP